MIFPMMSPHIARLIVLDREAEHLLSLAQNNHSGSLKALNDAIEDRVREAGIYPGRKVYQVQRDGKIFKRKVVAIQALHNSNGFEVAIHLENKDNDFGAVGFLPNVYLTAGKYEYIPRSRM